MLRIKIWTEVLLITAENVTYLYNNRCNDYDIAAVVIYR